MEKYYYLLIDFFTILFPFLYSFDKRAYYYKWWPKLFPALLFGGIPFLIWDHYFTVKGVWSFNEKYITGIKIFELPIEEILFFIVVPYACLFIYACMKYYFPKAENFKWTKSVWLIVAIFSAGMVAFYYEQIYTLVTFSLLVLIAAYFYLNPKKWHGYFILAYLFSMIPFFIVNGLLTSIPIVLYNDLENVGFRWGTIPFEDSFYALALLMLNVSFLERDKE